MPTGFNVETGFDLSRKLLSIVPSLEKILENSRKDGGRGPDKPMTASELCDRLGALGRVADSDIRAMVNYLRRNKRPIASTAHGYFWAVNHAELDFTRQHLRERVSAIRSALDGIENVTFDKPELF